MTITIAPENEALLCERAAREGQDMERLVNDLLAEVLTEEAEKQKAYHQALLASGLVRRITPPRDPSKADRPLIEVQGKPVSETIIEERR